MSESKPERVGAISIMKGSPLHVRVEFNGSTRVTIRVSTLLVVGLAAFLGSLVAAYLPHL